MREEFIEWDKQKKSLIVTRQEKIEISKTEDIEQAKQALEKKLRDIVRQIKTLKTEAQKIKLLLETLKNKAGSIDPAPDSEESQSSPAG